MDSVTKIYIQPLLIAAFCGVMPFLPHLSQSVAMDIMIFSIFALGFNIYFGHTGLGSFGHALYFGLGAYGTGFYLVYKGVSIASLPIGVAFATLGAIIIGYICLRPHGPKTNPAYLYLVLLAFSQLFYFLFLSPLSEYTGGSDGLMGIISPSINLPIISPIQLESWTLYYFLLAIFFVSLILLKLIVDSPFGRVLHAIRNNEARALALGYDTFKYKLSSIVISGFFGGIAGSFYCLRLTYVGLGTLHWLLGGEVIFMGLLGGRRTKYGPVLGAFLYLILKDIISAYTAAWQLFVGAAIILIMFLAPGGIWGEIKKRFLEEG